MKKFVVNIFLICFFLFFYSSARANYYDIFGVDQNASMKEIHAGYRRAIRSVHPDGYTDPEEKREMTEVFKTMQEWYAVLKDPQQRKQYDEFLRDTANDSQREDFKDWKDRRFSKNRGSRTNSSSNRGSRSHSQNDSSQRPPYSGTQLHNAIQLEDPEKAHRFVQDLLNIRGFDINAKDSNGDTALILAFKKISPSKYQMKIIKLLLAVDGLDINAKDSNGNTALAFAVAQNSDKIVLLLLNAGADPNIPCSDGPLLHALLSDMATRGKDKSYYYNDPPLWLYKKGMRSSLYILHYLKQHGIDVAHKNSAGLTPFHLSLLSRFFYYEFENAYRNVSHSTPIEYTKRLIDFLIRNGFADYLINNPQERKIIDSLFIERDLSDEFRLFSRHLVKKRSTEKRSTEMGFFDRCYAIF